MVELEFDPHGVVRVEPVLLAPLQSSYYFISALSTENLLLLFLFKGPHTVKSFKN